MKIAACFHVDGVPREPTVTRMVEAQRFGAGSTCRVIPVTNGAIGFTSGTEQLSRVPLMREDPSGNVLIVAGLPISREQGLDVLLQRAAAESLENAIGILRSLDGAYTALLWHAGAQRLAFVTDFLGMQPLHLSHTSDSLLLSTELKGLVGDDLLKVEPDPAGWGSFFSLGHFIGSRTSLRCAIRAMPAQVYTYNPLTAKLESTTYWRYPDAKPVADLAQLDTATIVDALRTDVRAYSEHGQKGTLLLSGGFDSRLLLMLLLEAGQRPPLLILDHPEEHFNADGRFARRFAALVSLPYTARTAPADFFSSQEYLSYLQMTEVTTPSLYLFIAQLAKQLSAAELVWEGVAPGNLLKPPGGESGEPLSLYLKKKGNFRDSAMWRAIRNLFRPNIADEMWSSFEQLLASEVAQYTDDSSGTSQFVVSNRMRNRTGANPFKVYCKYVLLFTPGVSRRFVESTAYIPYSRPRQELYLELYRRHFPQGGHVPFCSGGALFSGTLKPDLQLASLRLMIMPVVQRLYGGISRRLGSNSDWWEPSTLVESMVRTADPAAPEWNSDSVAQVQATAAETGIYDEKKHILFYWQIWKWVLGGSAEGASLPVSA